MPARTTKPALVDDSGPQPSFEQALEELEAIVEQMENEQLPLNELIDQYEKGVRLFSTCDKLLGEARERLELITLKARQDPAPTTANASDSESTDHGEPDDHDLRLR